MVNDSTPRPPEDEEEEEEEGMEMRKCRVCGCDDLHACWTEDGPCYWVEENLCSACASKKTKKREVRIVKDDKAQRRHV